jgi:alpha-tubulin suppressor-like RCC1 family protein
MRYVSLMCVVGLVACAESVDRLPTEPAPARHGSAGVWSRVSAGYGHTCGVTTLGQAYCWGSSAVGQLGVGSATDGSCASTPSGIPFCAAPVRVADQAFAAVSAGFDHTCGLTATGRAFCWGRGDEGQLGSFATSERCTLDGPSRICSSRPIAVASDLAFASIFAGHEYTCALGGQGAAWCWGSNAGGQLGVASTEQCRSRGSQYLIPCSSTPVPVSGGLRFVELALGSYHACGLTAAGEAFCWGHNLAGQLGAGDGWPSGSTPVAVAGGHRFTALTAGYDHTCGLDADGRAYCWGGDGPNRQNVRTTPAPIAGGLAFGALSRSSDHTCGVDGAGSAFCWGFNDSGQLGNGEASVCTLSCTVPFEPDPVRVLGALEFATISAGYQTTCGVTSDGTAYCWGLNYTGQLGTGSRESRVVPTAVADPR